jgi:hypothetical protein
MFCRVRTHDTETDAYRNRPAWNAGCLDTPLRQPRRHDAAKLTETQETNHDKPLTPITVKKIAEVLHRALEMAVRWDYIARNPADNADTPAVPRRELPALDPAELNRLIDCAIAEAELTDGPVPSGGQQSSGRCSGCSLSTRVCVKVSCWLFLVRCGSRTSHIDSPSQSGHCQGPDATIRGAEVADQPTHPLAADRSCPGIVPA